MGPAVLFVKRFLEYTDECNGVGTIIASPSGNDDLMPIYPAGYKVTWPENLREAES